MAIHQNASLLIHLGLTQTPFCKWIEVTTSECYGSHEIHTIISNAQCAVVYKFVMEKTYTLPRNRKMEKCMNKLSFLHTSDINDLFQKIIFSTVKYAPDALVNKFSSKLSA